jgi:hypothetical protein
MPDTPFYDSLPSDQKEAINHYILSEMMKSGGGEWKKFSFSMHEAAQYNTTTSNERSTTDTEAFIKTLRESVALERLDQVVGEYQTLTARVPDMDSQVSTRMTNAMIALDGEQTALSSQLRIETLAMAKAPSRGR